MNLNSIEKMPMNHFSVRENIMVYAHLYSKYGVDHFTTRHHLDCLEKAFLYECELSPDELNYARMCYKGQSQEEHDIAYNKGWNDGYEEAKSEFE